MSSLLYSAKLTLKILKHFYFCLQKNNSAVLVLPAFPIGMPKMAFSKSSEKDGVLIGYLRVWGFLLSSLHSSDLYITGIFSVSFLKDWRIPRKLIKYIYPYLFCSLLGPGKPTVLALPLQTFTSRASCRNLLFVGQICRYIWLKYI